MEDNFILPEKWFIIRNAENAKDVNKYNNSKFFSNAFMKDSATMFSDKSYCGGNQRGASCTKEYTEITYEQFKKYVLNKPTVSNESINTNYSIF